MAAREWLIVYAKGIAMGAADTVPGVSGGTIALIVGIYERLVHAIASLEPTPVRRLPRLTSSEERARLRDDLRAMDVGFLIVLGLGIATAVVLLSRSIGLALALYRAPTNAFFFGLIAASAVILYREVRVASSRHVFAALLAAAAAFILTGVTAAGAIPNTAPVVFVAGVLASAAMLLPGISGAAFLYVLGQYEYLINTLHAFIAGVSAVVIGADPTQAVTNGIVIGVFLTGFAVGVVTIAHVVRWALAADRTTTLIILVSLMVGALRLPVEEIIAATPRWTMLAAGSVVAAAVIGAAAVLLLDWYTDDLEYGEPGHRSM